MFDRLRKLAKSERRSLRYLCEVIGKSSSYINDTEKAGNCPPDKIVEIWAAALHTTPAYLMGETDDPSEGTKKEPATGEGDGLEKQLIAFYGEVKSYLDEDDLNDIKIFMQMKADYKKRKMMENHDKG